MNDLVNKNDDDMLTVIVEEAALPSPSQPLGALKRVKTRSIAVQTSVSNRVRIFSFK